SGMGHRACEDHPSAGQGPSAEAVTSGGSGGGIMTRLPDGQTHAGPSLFIMTVLREPASSWSRLLDGQGGSFGLRLSAPGGRPSRACRHCQRQAMITVVHDGLICWSLRIVRSMRE